MIFGILHSFLASSAAKELAARFFGESSRKFYRLFFVLTALLTTLVWLSLVFRLPDLLIYEIPAPWIYLTLALQMLSVIGLLAALSRLNRGDFLGISALRSLKSIFAPASTPELITTGLYRWVRHPIYTCTIIFIWLSPLMSWNLLAFDIGVTAYFIIGARLEEKKLHRLFDKTYKEYQKNTPMFLPIHLT